MEFYLKVVSLDVNYEGDRVGANASTGAYITCEESLTPECLRKYFNQGWSKLTVYEKSDWTNPVYQFLAFRFEFSWYKDKWDEFIVFSSEEEALNHQRSRSQRKIQARCKYLTDLLENAKSVYPAGSETPGVFRLNNRYNCSTGDLKKGGAYFSPYLSGREGRGAARICIDSSNGVVTGHRIEDWLGFSIPDEYVG